MKKFEQITMMIILAAALLVLPAVALAQVEDYVPSVSLGFPSIPSDEAFPVPPRVTFTVTGVDPDSPTGLPTMMRHMLIPGVAEDGTIIISRFRYENHLDEFVSFDGPHWTEWVSFPPNPAEARIQIPPLEDGQYYLLAIQVMDADGAVSQGRGYNQEVINFLVDESRFRPAVVVVDPFLGSRMSSTTSEIASGQPVNFSWIASADHYAGTIVSYRHGFDLISPDDPNDPGWSVPPGLAPNNLFAAEQIFAEGYHVFWLRVVDNLNQVAVFSWTLIVIPYISPEYQYPLMVIDQVVDDQTNAWPGPGGSPAYDKQEYRNAYWRFLEGAGGVANFSWDYDRWDHLDLVDFADMVWYKASLVYARYSSAQLMFREFRAVNNVDKYVWLAPYQLSGGNLFLVGAQSMESFLEAQSRYMVPIIFDTDETTYQINGTTYIVGFGQKQLPDGSLVDRGPLQYPYLTAGISALDWAVPQGKFVYGRSNLGILDRKATCAALKAVELVPDFKSNHQIGQGVIADRIGTNPLIDWRDFPPYTLDTTFGFAGDEFVDANISARTTPWSPQECVDGPDGLCVEPMFSGVARYDWVRENRWAAGDVDWPYSQYSPEMLDDICGAMALTSLEGLPQGTARTNGLTYGYLSYKNVADKPSGKADAYWGFDPYRFNHAESQNAIRWVLDYFGLQLNQ